jgi:hypothetical protein
MDKSVAQMQNMQQEWVAQGTTLKWKDAVDVLAKR